MFPSSRELCVKTVFLVFYCSSFQIQNSCSPCYDASHNVLAESLLKLRNISPLEPNVKCQSCEKTQTLSRLFTRAGTYHSMSGHFPRQTGSESLKSFKIFHSVLFPFSPSVFFHLSIYLSCLLFSFSSPSSTPFSTRLTCHSSSFVPTGLFPY